MHKCSLLTVAARGRLQALRLYLLFHHGMQMRRVSQDLQEDRSEPFLFVS